MLRSAHTTIFVFSVFVLSAQVNYHDFKQQNQLTCTSFDSVTVHRSLVLLDSLSHYEITEGREAFLYDYGMTKYVMYCLRKKEEDLKEALGYFEEGYSLSRISDFAWNLTLYSRLGECEKALNYLEQFIELRKEEGLDIDYEQVYYVQRRCCN